MPDLEPPPAAPSKVTSKTVLIILLVVGGACLIGVGILAALAIFGVRKYTSAAKTAEGPANVRILAEGIARCASEKGTDGALRGLPDTSSPVPGSLSAVSAKKYQSGAGEWSEPAFSCASFRVSEPQYFQYRWLRRSASSGAALALADLNGDGVAEIGFEQAVSCDPSGTCRAGAVTQTTP